MTAPNPGLTDLIAAEMVKHQFDMGAMWHDDHRACTCGLILRVGERHHLHVAAHVALVVEQHTNGRITELEADAANWEQRYEDAKKAIDAGTVNWTATIHDRDDWKATALDAREIADEYRDHAAAMVKRAEKAEAKVARVITALEAAEKSVPDDWGVTYIYTSQLRAALEGEQQ